MRVLFINHTPIEGSGSGLYTLSIAKEMRKSNVKSCILTPDLVDSERIQDEVNVKTFRVKISGVNDSKFPSFTGHPLSDLLYEDMEVNQIQEYRQQFLDALKSTIESFRPNVIHVQHLFLINLLVKEIKIPFVTTCHGSEVKFYSQTKSDYWKKTFEEAVKSVKDIIVISNYVGEILSKSISDFDQNICIIPNGYDRTIFHIRKDLESTYSQKNTFFVGGIGRLVKYKRFDLFLKAISIIQERNPNINVKPMIVGAGPLLNELMTLSDELKIDYMEFLGFQPQENLAEIISQLDMVVVPSENEPFGLIAIESLACGVPVVASASGGLMEFIDKEVGQLVKGWDPEEWANVIEMELKQSSKVTKKQNILNRAALYTWEQSVKRLKRLYEKNIEKS